MTILFVILIILASFILGMIVLIQNPKGGGLAGTFGGFSTQFMGVKQTTDVLEKGTWIFAGIIGLLCLVSTFFMSTGTAQASEDAGNRDKIQIPSQPAAPQGQSLPGNTIILPDTNK